MNRLLCFIMRNREWILPVLIMAVILLAVVPCSGDETRTITDLTGNKVIIPANITRAVNIDPFSGQFIYIIGADRKLVGTHSWSLQTKID